MNKKLIVITAISLIGIAGAGYWYFIARRGASPTPSETSNEEGSFIGSIADALKIGTAMKCTWSFEGESATFYVKDKKFSAQINPKDSPKTSYIQKDNCTYIWQEGEEKGFKTCYTPAEGEEDYDFSDVPNTDEGSIAAMGGEYTCRPAVISDEQFTLPTGVEFMDLSQYLQNTP